MPSITIYTTKEKVTFLENILQELKDLIAQELSCGDRALVSSEISLRIIVPEASLPIAKTELEILAHAYHERVDRQDEICVLIQEYIYKACPDVGSVYVWLKLCELGHSFKK